MMKSFLIKPVARVGGAVATGRGFVPNKPSSIQADASKLKNLQAEQRKMIVGSMLATGNISSALKQRGDMLASRINRLKNKS